MPNDAKPNREARHDRHEKGDTILESEPRPAPRPDTTSDDGWSSSAEIPGMPAAQETADVRVIAFYLPQYHPIAENDKWWGRGFTEWTTVSIARPYFTGHNQPQLPSDLGFYDLRLPEIRQAQSELAASYGIHGFCYHYYWFSGRRLLERPLNDVLSSGKPDFPFCICWANEPWSRRWDGSESEVLVAQEHDLETDKGFLADVLPLLQDPRYIRVAGCPLIVVYRVGIIPKPAALFDHWRQVAIDHGLPGLHICMAETFGAVSPHEYGCDAAVEFPPHNSVAAEINDRIPSLDPAFTGKIYDYKDVVAYEINRPAPPYLAYRTVMPGWDNTSRRRNAGNVFHGADPELYAIWLSTVVAQARQRTDPQTRIVFVNAWNEWGEGAHLEPDRQSGHAYLAATQRTLADRSDWRTLLHAAAMNSCLQGAALTELLEGMLLRCERLEMSNRYLIGRLASVDSWQDQSVFVDVDISQGKAVWTDKRGNIENVNRAVTGLVQVMAVGGGLFIQGWALAGPLAMDDDMSTFVTLIGTDGQGCFSSAVTEVLPRQDVIDHLGLSGDVIPDSAIRCGFRLRAVTANLRPGEYQIAVDHVLGSKLCRTLTMRTLVVG